MKNSLLPIHLAIVLGGCAEFQDTLVLQNDYNRNVRVSQTHSPVTVVRPLALSFFRGAMASTFDARLSEGDYRAIAESDAGVFYIAPYGSFAYLNNGEIESRVGGLVRSKQEPSRYLVWFFPYQVNSANWNAVASGAWTSQVRPGVAHTAKRPWIESDFTIPVDAVRPR